MSVTLRQYTGGTTVRSTDWHLPVSRLGPPSTLPRFRWQQPIPDTNTPPARGLNAEELSGAFHWGKDSILPYNVYDDYDRSQKPGEMPVVTLENDRLSIAIAPQFGGRLMRLFDRRLDRDLVFRNPVFQPANLAALNAWFSGGIEWNGLIPGHTPFTVAPVFCGVIETARGVVLRIYEFDRIVEATWQIDLFLPEGDDRLFVHGRIVNAAVQPKQAYWWTNVAVPTWAGMRIVSPADYAIEHVLPGNELARFAFPDPDRFDGSYPKQWSNAATSVFFRNSDTRRLFIAALDKDGIGLAQTGTGTLRGRKFFYFGTSRGGQHWMNYLARRGEGDYVEIQSGVTPTQNQRFELPGQSELHWTEVYGALSVDPQEVHRENYQEAELAVATAIDTRYPQDELAGIDAFLTDMSRQPVTRMISKGAPWGSRHERLAGAQLAAGLDFRTDHEVDFWDVIASGEKVPAKALDAAPEGFATSDLWFEALEHNRDQHGGSWLHDLMLGIAALDRNEEAEARRLFDSSVADRPSWLALRQQALVAADEDEAERAYLAAWATGMAPADLAVEIVQFLLRTNRIEGLERFVDGLPATVSALERVTLARAIIAARRGELDRLEALLGAQFATIREGETLPSDLWIELQRGRLAALLGREPSDSELSRRLAQHPVPEHLDFRMLSEQGTA